MAAGGEAAETAAGGAGGEWVGSVRAVGFMAVRLIGLDGKDQLRLYDEGEGEVPCLRGQILLPGRWEAGCGITPPLLARAARKHRCIAVPWIAVELGIKWSLPYLLKEDGRILEGWQSRAFEPPGEG